MNKLRQYFYHVGSTFWFVPGLIIFGATALAISLIEASAFVDQRMLARWPLLFSAKALRTAIEEVFGREQEVQRCRNHKIENVTGELPKEQQEHTRRLIRAAFKLSSAEEGEKRLEQIARQMDNDDASAARSLLEGIKEMFTLQRLKIPASRHKCLATTNLIDSPHSGVRKRTRNVCRWRDADIAERWAATAWLLTREAFSAHRCGHLELWSLVALLGCESSAGKKEKVA